MGRARGEDIRRDVAPHRGPPHLEMPRDLQERHPLRMEGTHGGVTLPALLPPRLTRHLFVPRATHQGHAIRRLR